MKDYCKGFYYWLGATHGIMVGISSMVLFVSVIGFIKGFIKGLFGF